MSDAGVFTEAVRQLVLALGGVETPDPHLPGWVILQLETRAGRLQIRPTDAAIYCRFEEPARAAEALVGGADRPDRLNRHTGKWNHTWSPGEPGERQVDEFRQRLAPVLPASAAAAGTTSGFA